MTVMGSATKTRWNTRWVEVETELKKNLGTGGGYAKGSELKLGQEKTNQGRRLLYKKLFESAPRNITT